jgi:hypothetical protein
VEEADVSAIDEVMQLEEQLRQAEIEPNPRFFSEYLADDVVLDGQQLKARVVEAHRPESKSPKFRKVEMSDFKTVEHGPAVVVTCQGHYEGDQFTGTLKFMRVWLKEGNRWQVIAGSTTQ